MATSPSRRPLPGSPAYQQQESSAVPDKETIIASFNQINWDDYGRTLIDGSEVSN